MKVNWSMNESNMFTIIKDKNLFYVYFFKIAHVFMHYTQNECVHTNMLFPINELNCINVYN